MNASLLVSEQRLGQALALLERSVRTSRPHELVQTYADVARLYADEGALGAAEAYLEQALRWSQVVPGVDTRVDLLCELAEVAACSAERQERGESGAGHRSRARARQHAFEAAQLADRVADAGWEIRVLLRASDVYDRCGSREEAVQLQSRAVRLMARERRDAAAGESGE